MKIYSPTFSNFIEFMKMKMKTNKYDNMFYFSDTLIPLSSESIKKKYSVIFTYLHACTINREYLIHFFFRIRM